MALSVAEYVLTSPRGSLGSTEFDSDAAKDAAAALADLSPISARSLVSGDLDAGRGSEGAPIVGAGVLHGTAAGSSTRTTPPSPRPRRFSLHRHGSGSGSFGSFSSTGSNGSGGRGSFSGPGEGCSSASGGGGSVSLKMAAALALEVAARPFRTSLSASGRDNSFGSTGSGDGYIIRGARREDSFKDNGRERAGSEQHNNSGESSGPGSPRSPGPAAPLDISPLARKLFDLALSRKAGAPGVNSTDAPVASQSGSGRRRSSATRVAGAFRSAFLGNAPSR